MNRYTRMERVRLARQNPSFWKECFELLLEEHQIVESRCAWAEGMLERAKPLVGIDQVTTDSIFDGEKWLRDLERGPKGKS